MQHPTNLELATNQLGKLRLNDTTLMVAGLVPWVREKQQDPIQACISHALAKHFQGIAAIDTHIGQLLCQKAIQQRADPRTVDLNTNEVLLRRCGCHFQ